LWQTIIFEYPKRIPYLDVLVHLKIADAIFILGSTEPHYTPSKTYQAVLSGKPIWAVLHEASTAAAFIDNSGAGKVLNFAGEFDLAKVGEQFVPLFLAFQDFVASFKPEAVNKEIFSTYSAKNVTGQLAALLDKVMARQLSKTSE